MVHYHPVSSTLLSGLCSTPEDSPVPEAQSRQTPFPLEDRGCTHWVTPPWCIRAGGREGFTQERKWVFYVPPNPPCWSSRGRLIRRLTLRRRGRVTLRALNAQLDGFIYIKLQMVDAKGGRERSINWRGWKMDVVMGKLNLPFMLPAGGRDAAWYIQA